MNPVGYSGKPLIEKLGYKPTETIYLLNSPAEFSSYLKNEGVVNSSKLPVAWAHAFFNNQNELGRFVSSTNFEQIEKGFWVSWPKKSSGYRTDLTEQTFRDIILPTGWVDVKVVAIDDTWSGLKFLRRK